MGFSEREGPRGQQDTFQWHGQKRSVPQHQRAHRDWLKEGVCALVATGREPAEGLEGRG